MSELKFKPDAIAVGPSTIKIMVGDNVLQASGVKEVAYVAKKGSDSGDTGDNDTGDDNQGGGGVNPATGELEG